MNTFTDWFEQQKLRAEAAKREKIELRPAAPTYPARNAMPVEEAREKVASDFDELIRAAEQWWQRHPATEEPVDDDPFAQYARDALDDDDEEPPPVHAQRSPTGVGKTRVGAKEIAADRKRRQLIQDRSPLATRPWGYFGPTHRLNESTAGQFREPGLTAKVYYGRTAWDREIPGNGDLPEDKRVLMCLKPELVDMAIKAHQSVTETCCYKKPRRGKGGREEFCEHFQPGCNQCGYQKQFNGGAPDVWLAPHQMLFHDQSALSKLAGVIIDESFWTKGVYGVGEAREPLTLDEIIPPDSIDYFTAQEDTRHRIRLVKLLLEHPLGGLQRERFIDKLDEEDCTDGIKREWEIVKRVKMSPEMTEEQLEAVKQLLPEIRRARRMATVWRALRDLLKSDIKVSGRLILARKDGKTVLRVRGVRDIVKARRVPSVLLDATLPDVSILEKFHPQVEIVSDVEVKMPHVRVRQILGAPTSETKLWGTERDRDKNPDTGEGNRRAVRRYILQRWLEIDGHQRWLDSGRQPLVIICQKKYHEWLEESGLPEGIAVEHYNAIAGLDDYKHVDCLILIGRVVPKPVEVEAYAGALSGAEPLSEAATGRWYGRVPRGIRMADGSGIEVERCDQHCDPMGEAVRYQICEAELVQGLGRGRGVNRTAETPLDVDILADVVLPVTVNEVVPWEEPSEAVEMMATAGVVLTSPKDMTTAFPWLWKTVRAAKWTLKKLRARSAGSGAGTEDIFPIDNRSSIGEMSSVPTSAALYQRAGSKQKLRDATFDARRHASNLRAGLETLLKETLAGFWHYLRARREIPPMAGDSKVAVGADVLKAAERAPRKPLTTPAAEAYSILPLELRLLALGLHETKGSGEYINKQ
jgi:putative DNA primase/helicase